MQNILLIGLGRFGRSCAFKLNELDQQVMAVDKEEERVNKVLSFVTHAEIGDGTDVDFLKSLGVRDYDICIVAIGDDFVSSLETTSLLKDLGAKRVIARAASLTQEKFLLRNGADEVVFPEKQLALWTAIKCSSKNIRNYIELSEGYSIYEVDVPEEWTGKSIGDLDIRKKYDINILGARKLNAKHYSMSVTPDLVLDSDCSLLVLAKDADLRKCFKI
jgi:trk system potassium uptake protein TrkA